MRFFVEYLGSLVEKLKEKSNDKKDDISILEQKLLLMPKNLEISCLKTQLQVFK